MNRGDRVRIVKVTARPRAKIGSASPQVGDVGVVRFAMKDSGQQLRGYMVTCARPGGNSSWMADFTADEVETAEPAVEAAMAAGDRVAFMANALAYAQELVAAAKANGHIRGIGDPRFCWLAAESADAFADLLRAAGLAFIHIDRTNKAPLEHFQPVSDGAFWAKLDPVRGDKGIAKLHFRKGER